MRRHLLMGTVAILATACSSSSGGASPSASPAPAGSDPASAPASASATPAGTAAAPLTTSPPPWAAPAVTDAGARSAAYVQAAHLSYGPEDTTVHYHAHLDVRADGTAVTVPAYLGFVTEGRKVLGLAPLHTHDDTGVIHIESPSDDRFTLGQVFTEWGVRFTARCLGPFCTGAGKELAVYVDGTRYDGDPTQLVLADHQEIAVIYGATGSAGPPPPSSYPFPDGL